MTNREIDALVAERVMGWRLVTDSAELARMGYRTGPGFHDKGIYFAGEEWKACIECGNVPEFSADPAASKQLRDKMRADGFDYELNATKRDGIWATFSHPGTVEDFTTYGDTEEMAVALAALKAFGVEVPA